MIRLAQIEWIKNKSNPSFWVLLALYMVGLYMVCSLGTVLMNATINTYSDNGDAQVPMFNIYEFPDVWHNLSYLGSYVRIFLGITMVVSIANEISYRTLRQNIIDGLSPFDFLLTKVTQNFLISIVSTVALIIVVLYYGMKYSDSTSSALMIQKLEFAGAFFIQSLTFMSFAMFITLLFRSTGLSIVFVIAYSFFLELILKWIFLDSEGFIAKLLPIESMDNLISSPINLMNPQDSPLPVEMSSILIALGWFFLFTGMSYFLLTKRDLK